MINQQKLSAVLAAYKEYFPEHFKDEMYKWEAIKQFQDHWNIHAGNFADMFMEATAKTINLLANMNNYPRGMIKSFATVDPEAVRAMFMDLYDENKDLAARIDQFMGSAEELRAKYDDGTWKQHYQTTNAISTYLWLKYPDKYYIYKYSECRAIAKELESDFIPKKGGSTVNVEGGFKLYDEIRQVIQTDDELDCLLKDKLQDGCYPDPGKVTMTVDVGFFVSRFYNQSQDTAEQKWFPEEYTPNISVEQWKDLLKDKEVFTDSSLKIMRRFLDYGGTATCKQLSIKYGETPGFYNLGSSQLAKRVAAKTGCPLMEIDYENSKWWPILFLGKHANKKEAGQYVWKIRDELKKALETEDLSGVQLYEKSVDSVDIESLHSNAKFQKWLYPVVVALRDLGGSASRKDVIDKIVELYELTEEQLSETTDKAGTSVVINDIDWARNYLVYEGILDKAAGTGIWTLTPLGSRIVISEALGEKIVAKWIKINAAKRENKPIPDIDLSSYYEFLPEEKKELEKYTKADFLNSVYMTDENYETLAALLKNKKNIILQGAPGVGKTFAARRLAWSLMGEKDDSRIKFVQFHQNYSYEDFIIGYKPQENGFKLQSGIFLEFCNEVQGHPDKDYYFIIDEINRGNMSKIFGELLMLIEKDYRGVPLTLAYTRAEFSVPKNLYIIGMMNTADRSLAMIDYALRRRFSFYEMTPGFNTDGFQKYQASLQNETFNDLIKQIGDLNREIKTDDSLGEGFLIGHSYFCEQTKESCTDEWMKSVVYYDILPMLREYWFDDKQKVQKWENSLTGVFND